MFAKIFSGSEVLQSNLLANAGNIEAAATIFSDFIANFEPARVDDWSKQIKDLEHRCDDVTHEIMNVLQSTFIVNYDREDIHELASDIDDIVDLMDAAATRIQLYEIKEAIPPVVELSRQLKLASHATAKALRMISTQKVDKSVVEVCKEIKAYEEQADKIYHSALATLFRNYKDPLLVIKWREVIEEIEASLDKCNRAANDIEGIFLKYG